MFGGTRFALITGKFARIWEFHSFAGHIRFHSKLADVGSPLVRQLGWYLRWPSVEPGLLKRPTGDRDLQTCRGYLSKGGHVDVPNRGQLALLDCSYWGFLYRAFIPSCTANARVYHVETGRGPHSSQAGRLPLSNWISPRALTVDMTNLGSNPRKPSSKVLPSHKAYCLLSNGPHFARVEAFNRHGKLVSASAIPVIV